MTSSFRLGNRPVGRGHPPLVVPEIGINHEGSIAKAKKMVDDAARAGAEVVKFQTHSAHDEMIPNDVVPGNAAESIWDIIARCTLTRDEERELKRYTESKGMLYLSTPFSREAADFLDEMGVSAFKIGSGECNNLPLVKHIASYGKPLIVSTGMNDMTSVARTVEVVRDVGVPYALLHCTSLYPTPWPAVRLGALDELNAAFPDAVVGLSDHTLTNHVAFASVALGAAILERHFTSDKGWPGPDIEISMSPRELKDLIQGSKNIFQALGGSKEILPEEQPTIAFAYASIVTTADISKGDVFSAQNLWVKRPGTGDLRAADYDLVLGKVASRDLPKDHLLQNSDIA